MNTIIRWVAIFVVVTGAIVATNAFVYADDDDDDDKKSRANTVTPTSAPQATPAPTYQPAGGPTPTPRTITPTPTSVKNPTPTPQPKNPTPTQKPKDDDDDDKEEGNSSRRNRFVSAIAASKQDPPKPANESPANQEQNPQNESLAKKDSPTNKVASRIFEYPLSKLLRVTPQQLYENHGLTRNHTLFLLTLASSLALTGLIMIWADVYFSRAPDHKLAYSS